MKNRLLSQLGEEDLNRLEPHLKVTPLSSNRSCSKQNRKCSRSISR